MAIAAGPLLGREVRQSALQPGFDGRGDGRGAEGVGQLLQPVGRVAGDEDVVVLAEADARLLPLARKPLVAVEADAGVEGEVRAQPHEEPAQLGIAQVEVIYEDVPPGPLEFIAALRVADDQAGAFAALQEDGQPRGRGELAVEGLDPLVAANAVGGGEDGKVSLAGLLLEPAVVVVGDAAEVGGGEGQGLTLVAQEGGGTPGPKEGLDVGVAQDAVEAVRAEGEVRGMVVDEGVPGSCRVWIVAAKG